MARRDDDAKRAMRETARKLDDALSGRGAYEVHFPDGRVQLMTWNQLHVNLKARDRRTYDRVKYRWVRPN